MGVNKGQIRIIAMEDQFSNVREKTPEILSLNVKEQRHENSKVENNAHERWAKGSPVLRCSWRGSLTIRIATITKYMIEENFFVVKYI